MKRRALMVGAGAAVGGAIFLRPAQSERVLAELGDLAVVSAGKLVDSWPVLSR